MKPARPSRDPGRRGGAAQAAEKLSAYLSDGDTPASPAGGRTRGVLADTSAWIDFFRGQGSGLAEEMERLLREQPMFTCGPVVSELLQGVKSGDDRDAVLAALGSLEYVEAAPRTWLRAGEIARTLRRAGRTLPHSDVLIAALAIEHRLEVLTADRHFREIPGVALVPLALLDGEK